MLANWTKILPYCFIAWYARRYCEVFDLDGTKYVQPYNEALIIK